MPKDEEEHNAWITSAVHRRSKVIQALTAYDIEISSVHLAGSYTNWIYHIRANSGAEYAARVCRPGWRTDEDLRSEILWLQALRTEPEIGAPIPQLTRDGQPLSILPGAFAGDNFRLSLMTWLPGRLMGKHLYPSNLFKMGQVFARLHLFSETYQPPPGFTHRQMDSPYARGEEDILFSPSCVDAFSPGARRAYENVRQRVADAFSRRYSSPAGLRVIHNDLWHGNIKIDQGRLRPFDFEDAIWGFPVQDIAMAFQDLRADVPPARYELLIAAFKAGYETFTPWPEAYEGEIDSFMAGRVLWVSNYVARFEPQYLSGFLERVTPPFEHYLATGELR